MTRESMRIAADDDAPLRPEIELLGELLPLDGARVLELGCGTAAMTRLIAERYPVAGIVATEVDTAQHAKNLAAAPIPDVSFAAGGAERIDAADSTFDLVLMFKSLHHVPGELMDAALEEVARVLRPGGLAWVSEPVYAGPYNDIMKLFHDERMVREQAFAAVRKVIEKGWLELVRQCFFRASVQFTDFAEFDRRMLQVTHTEHRLDDELYARVRSAFEAHLGPGGAEFAQPMRVDLLRCPA
ncbi:MAG: SAM-dependent methyltransferase [Gammaproteobacteria bacterium]|nr:MAG: SAM-dependent methyltransferase [Gammaproteobacteria bacterium]